MSMFQKAQKSQVKLRVSIIGPSGSGKTKGALLIATGISNGGKIAVADTENGSSALYADEFNFDMVKIAPPYTTDKYLEAMADAAKAGYTTLILDSITHQWAGEGGLLQRKEALDQRGGDSFRNWGKMTPEQNKFISAILNSPINLICTIRSKTEYAMTGGGDGKKASVKKLGMAPVQRDGVDYEFDLVLDVDRDSHMALAAKNRTGLFGEEPFKITLETGTALRDWQLNGAAPVTTPPPAATPPKGEFKIPFGDFKGMTFAAFVEKKGGAGNLERWLESLQAWADATRANLKGQKPTGQLAGTLQGTEATIKEGTAWLDKNAPRAAPPAPPTFDDDAREQPPAQS